MTAAPPDEERQRRVLRITIIFLLGITVTVGLLFLLRFWFDTPWTARTSVITAGVGLVYVVALVAERTGRLRSAAVLLAAGTVLGSWLPVFVPEGISGDRSYFFVAMNVLIVSMAVGWRAGTGVAAVDVALLAVVAAREPAYASGLFLEDLLQMLIFATVFVTLSWARERDRRGLLEHRERLSESLADTRAILEASSDAALSTDTAGRVIVANPAACELAQRLYGLRLEPGTDLLRSLPTPVRQAAREALKRVLRDGSFHVDTPANETPALDGRQHAGDERESTADGHGSNGNGRESGPAGLVPGDQAHEHGGDGQPSWFEVRMQAIRTRRHVVGVAVQVRDITDMRQAAQQEQDLFRQRVQVENLREMDQFKTRLLNTASHELRTPLTPLRLQVALMRANLQHIPERLHRGVRVLERNTRRLGVLVDDLLDVSRLEAQRMEIRPRPVDLAEVARQEVEGFQDDAGARGIHLRCDGDAEVPVDADPERIGQVVSNLLANALKFTDAGGHVTVRCAPSADGVAALDVEDTGRGFEPVEAEAIFRPFHQIQDVERGSGLGLYISRGILSLHGGTIEAHSEGEGRGATFRVRMPLRGRPAIPVAGAEGKLQGVRRAMEHP